MAFAVKPNLKRKQPRYKLYQHPLTSSTSCLQSHLDKIGGRSILFL